MFVSRPLRLLLSAVTLTSVTACWQQVPEAGSVQALGSETLSPLAEACAIAFIDKNPDADILVQGGGSGDGLEALLHGVTDIAMSSRDINAKEREEALSKGMTLVEHDVALDGIAVIVNNANPVAALDISQLGAIYSAAQAPNWQAFGGTDKEIMVFARGGSSGTAALFQEKVLGATPQSALVHPLLDNDAVVAAVASQPGAIGYASLAAVTESKGQVRTVALKPNAQSAPGLPAADSIRSGVYPLARKLHFYTAGQPRGTVKAFIQACQEMGKEGLAEELGYVGLAAAEKH
jgi:phosphate transport system substrate-binding protein